MEQSKRQSPGFRNSVYTFVVFVGFISLFPVWFSIYFSVKICRNYWLGRLIRKYPHLEIVKKISERSAMDTYRCQGIVSVVLQIRGQCNIELVKQKIKEDVIDRRNKDGSLRFPHMKKTLTSCWGRYAWVNDTSEFNLHNHVVHVENPMLRNRIVTSANIQDYVSDMITKYIPPWNKIPPWQILIITTEPDKFYILARVHHLYISEDGISFNHLLMIDPEETCFLDTPPQDMDCIENLVQTIYKKPKAMPVLYDNLCGTFANTCNEMVSAYDPLQNPRYYKSSPNIIQFNMICVITVLAVLREYYKTGNNLIAIFKKEAKKRQISVRFFLRCFINTMYPLVVIKIAIVWSWWVLIKGILHLPISILHIMYHTPIYLKWLFLTMRVVGETFYLFHLIYTTPRILLDELVLPMFHSPRHHLQKVSLSGRKVVCWTEPIPIEIIRKIRNKTRVASCEIQLYAVAAALNEYFAKYKLTVADEILTTTRFIPQEDLLKSSNRISSGLLCLSLPMNMPEDDPLYGLKLMQLSLQDAIENQTAVYLASLWQYDYGIMTIIFPSILARIALYVLSTRYSVMMTLIEAHTKEMKKRHLVWGQEIESFIYWRPPQANISMSLTIINYGDEMRFAVMADAELSPEYTVIVSQFASYINQLAEEVENYSTSSSVEFLPDTGLYE